MWDSEVKRGRRREASRGEHGWENSSAAARIIRKINYFPGLLINFTIALPSRSSLYSFPRMSVAEEKQERKRESEEERERRQKERTRSKSFLGCLGLIVFRICIHRRLNI